MRFLAITKRRSGPVPELTAVQAADHFRRTQEYFDRLAEEGKIVDEGKLVGEHARFQIFEVASREELDGLLRDAPNTPLVDRDIYRIGPIRETVDRLARRAAGGGVSS